MYKPGGYPAQSIDPLILLNIWAHHVAEHNTTKRSMIFAGLGKPTYILNKDIAIAEAGYWNTYVAKNQEVAQFLSREIDFTDQSCDEMIKMTTAIDYGLPAGEYEFRTLLAQAFSRWYKTDIQAEHVIFSVGACAMLSMLFRVINERSPQGKIVTPMPYYPFYNNPEHGNRLHLIDLMDLPGYRLTAQALQKSIDQAGDSISAFLFCDPSNPVGFTLTHDEWKNIADILKKTNSSIPIILDEAYGEMIFYGEQHVSLLTVAPELKDRLIVLRSATKALSASGERMAAAICFNSAMRQLLINETTYSYLHAPKSLQYGYAHAMSKFTPVKSKNLSEFYRIQVELAANRLKKMGAYMPSADYRVESTFYILADLSKFLGSPFPTEAQQALGKKEIVSTDEDICYSLLFNDQLMIAPLSYFGADPHKGFVRITCSSGIEGINELMDRLEDRLASIA